MFRVKTVVTSVAVLCLATLIGLPVDAEDKRPPGYVDSSAFVELAGGDEQVRVEINIYKSMLQIVCKSLDEDLKDIVCGLDSIRAVILELESGQRGQAVEIVRTTSKNLRGRGWERMALVREDDEEVHVLVLNDEDRIEGLVVMVASEDELIFTNIAGVLDLAAIQRIGDEMDLPGLDDLDLDELGGNR